jgi:alpha,alpha-trehalase
MVGGLGISLSRRQLLQTVNIAKLFADPKTVVDKPTSKPSAEVLTDFAGLDRPFTYGNVTNFVNADFRGEGQELEALELPNFNSQPAVLNSVQSPLLRAFTQVVHGYWTQLIRGTNESALCIGGVACESTLIPLNHTFVVPGGRFREQCKPILLLAVNLTIIYASQIIGIVFGSWKA